MKLKIYFIINCFLFLIIVIRLTNLIFFSDDKYQDLLIAKTTKYITLNTAPRGRILDINHNVLVDNKSVKTITYTKLHNITTEEELLIAKRLSEIITLDDLPSLKELKIYYLVTHDNGNSLLKSKELQMYEERKLTKEDIYNLKLERITEKMLDSINPSEALIYNLMNKGYSYDTKIIKNSGVTDQEYATINEQNIKGVKGSISWERVYLYGDLLRNIYGSISKEGIPSDLLDYYAKTDYKLNDKVGISGLELQYDYFLKGEKALYLINQDKTLTLVKEGSSGNDLVLNIDINILKGINDILKTQMLKIKKEKNTKYYNHSYVIVSKPTGELVSINALKLVGNSFVDISHNIINSSYTLGSVIKGASSSVNYLNNLITPGTKILDSCIKLYLVPTKCSHRPLGRIDDVEALANSSNYYQYLTAIKYTNNEYRFNMKLEANSNHFNYYRYVFGSYGLGVKTNIDLPNEQIGLIGTKTNADLLLNLAIGQYDTYTPIELVQYINTIASGERVAPNLLNKVINNNQTIYTKEYNKLNDIIIDNNSLTRLRLGFRSVVTYGTAKNYAKGYEAAGKTGTSESFLDTDNNGIIDQETTTTSAVLYVPYDNPKYTITIISPHISNDERYVSNANKNLSNKIMQFLFEK